MTVRALRPRSSVPALNFSSSSMTSNGITTSLSANMNSALGLCSRTLVSTTKCFISPVFIVSCAVMSLYPLKFKPRLVEKIWGGRKLETVLGKTLPPGKPIGESWELYDFPPGVVEKSDQWVSAEVANGPLTGQTLHSVVSEFGPELYGDVAMLGEQ